MALTFPLPLADFADRLRVTQVSFGAQAVTEQSMTGAGEILTRSLGPALWSGQIEVATDRREDGREAKALIEMLTRPGASFLMRDLAYDGPKEDPAGAILGAASPVLAAVAGSGDVTINGLPALYWLRAGDYFGFTYGTGPVRYALHQVVVDKRAGTGGSATGIVVHPRIRTGWTAGTPVTLIKPVCKAVIVPGSVSEGVYGPVAMTGLSFRWQQTLR